MNINQCTLTREYSFTPAGNMHPLSNKLVVTWVKQAWDAVSSEVIIDSLMISASGIILNPNGSEDEEICCPREGEETVMAVEGIRRQTAGLAERDDDEDHFSGLSDDEAELETNELVVEDDTESD